MKNIGCYGKRAYDTFKEAESAIRWAAKKGLRPEKPFRDTRLQSYRCRICGHWHVGNGVKKAVVHDLPRRLDR